MTRSSKARSVAFGLAMLLVGVGLSAAFPGRPQCLVGLALMAPTALLLGLGLGQLPAAAVGSAVLAYVAAAGIHGRVPAEGLVAVLALCAAALVFPRVLAEWGRAEEGAFAAQHGPVAAERDAMRGRLEGLRARAVQVEREGRETDAMFHVASEIGKLLSLEDTLEFLREIFRDTLKPSGGVPPAFVVALAGEEGKAPRVEVAEGVEVTAADALFAERDGPFTRWLRASLDPVWVRSVAGEPALKGAPLPPAVRGLLSVPLAIEGRAIGWVLVLDLGAGLSASDVANLGILCPQFAIGLEKALLYERLRRLSVTDGLTGLTVHRHFQSRLDEELKRAERYHEPLSLVMGDIDHFKRFNDTWGHLAGDQVLKAVAGVFREGLGASELAVRYGGEEFVLVLPKTPKAAALERAEALRRGVRALTVEHEGRRLAVTVSLGVAAYPDDAMTKSGLIDRADEALYRSKEGGRDRVTAA